MKIKNTLFFAGLVLLMSGCSKDDINPKDSGADLPEIVINEFMASNLYSFQDPQNEGEFDDWIEIYNTGDKPVNLGGYYISDNKNFKSKFRIPTTNPDQTTIPPGGYILIWADGEPSQGPLHVDFKLSVDGEDLGIYTEDGRIIDETTFGYQKTDVSAGRLPNGTGPWTVFVKSTPGSANK